MEIRIRELNNDSFDDFDLLVEWFNNEEIKHLITPNFAEKSLPTITAEELMYGFSKSKDKYYYIVESDGVPIGDLSISVNPEYLAKKIENTGWISINIGKDGYRNKGIGKIAMEFMEKKCKALGLKRIELGVFEYNSRAIYFYEKLGYKKFREIENFTYFDGKWWNDFRMEKYI